MANENRQAIVLLSGGLDSTTSLAIATDLGYDCRALSFSYNQRHSCELDAARRVCKAYGITEHRIIDIDPTCFVDSALTNSNRVVPTDRSEDKIKSEIPITYVPARNLIFLSYALGWAESCECFDIFIGVNSVDYSGYPDCRPEFIYSFEKTANLGTAAASEKKGNFKIHAPLMNMSKKEIILAGIRLGVDYSITHSCYNPDANAKACGHCDSCLLRIKGFEQAGVNDPAEYQ